MGAGSRTESQAQGCEFAESYTLGRSGMEAMLGVCMYDGKAGDEATAGGGGCGIGGLGEKVGGSKQPWAE